MIEKEKNTSLLPFNTLALGAVAGEFLRIDSIDRLHQCLLERNNSYDSKPFILGGGSNVALISTHIPLVFKIEIKGMRWMGETATHLVVEAGAGELWHDLVTWTLAEGVGGLENLASIPGTVGAAPVQNIGAYGVELKDRFFNLDCMDVQTGELKTLDAKACAFGYRDSVFKHQKVLGAKKQAQQIITHVRLALPKKWMPQLAYHDLKKRAEKLAATDSAITASARQIFEWVCDIRKNKLPDPKVLPNVGSFFKNPVVSKVQLHAIKSYDSGVVYYETDNKNIKLAGAYLIEKCGWCGKRQGNLGVYENQSLVLVNYGGATGADVMTLAQAIKKSVSERYGINLDIEPECW